MPHLVPGGARAQPAGADAGRPVRGAGRVRDPAAGETARPQRPLCRGRGLRPRGRWRHLPARIRRRRRDRRADASAARDRGAGDLGGADAAAVSRARDPCRLLPPALRGERRRGRSSLPQDDREPAPHHHAAGAWPARQRMIGECVGRISL